MTMTFKYKNETYEVIPYFYKVTTDKGKIYYGIKFSRWSANPELLGVNYFTSSKSITKKNIAKAEVLRQFPVKSLKEYKKTVRYLKALEYRFLRFYKLLRNENCLNRNCYGDGYVHYDNDALLRHLKSQRMRSIVSRQMTEYNPMFNDDSRLKMIKTQKENWKKLKEGNPEAYNNFCDERKGDLSKLNTDAYNAFCDKISKGVRANKAFMDKMHNNNPMYNEEACKRMVKTKMYNSLKTQEQYMISCGMDPDDIDEYSWERYRLSYKKNTGKNKYLFTYEMYKKWVLDADKEH